MYRRHAFTLIELLVVISIIALLISILLPALGAARQTAIDATCLSTQRQLGIAAMVYVNESDGMLPASEKSITSWNPTTQWQDKIGTHVWSETGGFEDPGWDHYYDRDGNTRIVTNPTPLHCPVTSENFPRRYRFFASTDYSINWYLGGRPGGGDTIKYPNDSHLASDRFWFADAGGEPRSGGSIFYPGRAAIRSNPFHSKWDRNNTNTETMPWMWLNAFSAEGHGNNAANYLYGDGHAQALVFDTVDDMNDAQAARFTGSDLK